ncbi:MAG: hypothetical protein C0408_00370 [Odoribacter sp.]|nr:hypothetical protein [Odoribacter sp.]
MPIVINRDNILIQPFIFLAILFFYEPLFSQNTASQDTTLKIPKGSYILFKDNRLFIQEDTVIEVPGTLVRADLSGNDKTITFYDSLKSKASRKLLTKALFDLVIVSPDSINRKKIVNNSQDNFIEYSGKKIRNIQIQRLNVFGANVNNPGYLSSRGIDKLLNNTHISTNENIIRKYLFFSEGDTISPLTLSDNERIIRQLPYIDDARIIVIPVSGEEADIIVITKDVYSLGGDLDYKSKTSGTVRIFEKNIFGMGHEFELDIPYSSGATDSPGIGLNYNINNIQKSFIDLNINYYNGLGKKTYGLSASKKLISSTTKYAGGISVSQTYTTADLDTLLTPHPLKYNFQDYWLLRSFLINRESVTRIITGIRFINNNVFERPLINPDSYHSLQKYKFLIGTAALSIQKYYKTSLIYSYGRTEDIPYGILFRLTAGMEINEFRNRAYSGIDISFGHSSEKLGYFYTSAGLGTYINDNHTSQGVLLLKLKYFSNLIYLGSFKIRNFINIDYTRGFNRNTDEYLAIPKTNGFTGFSNDSLRGAQRVILSLESVVFNPVNIYGFRFAFFGFTDMAFLAGTNEVISKGRILSGIGLGIRIRNDNLVFNTFQIKLGFFPDPPQYSRINYFSVSGEQMLRPNNFDTGPPSEIPYR